MSSMPRIPFLTLLLLAGLGAGCASRSSTPAVAGGLDSIEGTVAAIDTAPWAYDGNAVLQVDTAARGRVAVQLPARWNLCKAPPVDVETLAVGMQVRAVGAADAEGGLVVCADAAHRVEPACGSRTERC